VEDGKIRKSVESFGSSPDTLLSKVDKRVVNIFFLEENIFFFFSLQERRAHLLVDGSVAMETQELNMKKMF
jgi:hypothetical protein